MVGLTLEDAKNIAEIATPFVVLFATGVIVPQLRKINRRHFIFETKIDCIIYANGNMKEENNKWSKEWSELFDNEYGKKLREKRFVENM